MTMRRLKRLRKKTRCGPAGTFGKRRKTRRFAVDILQAILILISMSVTVGAQDEIADADSRGFSALNNTLNDPPIADAFSREYAVWSLTIASVEERSDLPARFMMNPARPNPLTGKTNLTFGLPAKTAVYLAVFDVTGRRIKQVLDGKEFPAGWRTATINGSTWETGIYFYRLNAGENKGTGKLVVRR